MKDTKTPRRHRRGWLTGAALSVPILFSNCPPSQPAAPNKNVICFRDTGAFPSSGGPVIDGNPAELNWTGSFRYVFPNAVGAPHGIVQGLKDSSFLYLSFEINNDPFFNDKDAILLGFRPTANTPANDRRIFIFPNCDAVSPCNNTGGAPRTVLYWNDSGAWANASGVTDPSWLTNTGNPALSNIRVGSPGPNQWQVEIRIPINNLAADTMNPNNDSGINFPVSGPFGFWFDVIRVTSAPGTPPPLTANELAWPPGAAYGSNQANLINLRQNMPAFNLWGNGRRDPTNACNGVTVEWSDIKVEHPDTVNPIGTDVINRDPTKQNVFTVTPWNDSVDQNNNYVAAEKMIATFKIRNIGLPGPNFQQVGVLRGNPPANNPTAPLPIPAAVPPSFGTAKLSTGPWKLNAQEVIDYTAQPSQCILAELDTQSNAIILNKSTHTNMSFISTNSPFRVRPTIDLAGYRLPEGRDQLEFLLSTFTYHTDRELPWSTELQGAQPIGKTQYLLRGKVGAQVDLATTITPPNIRIPSVDVKVGPGTGGRDRKPEVARVKPGDVLTILTDGAIQVRREGPGYAPLAGPEGIRLAKSDRQPTERSPAFLLGSQHDPESRVGALVGSWDNFGKTSFVVGRVTTVKVPAGAEALYLAINDTADGFAQHSGEGFQVQVVETAVEQKYVSTDSRLARDPAHEMIRMPVAANLPMWVLCGERKTGKKLAIDQDTFELTENVGCFGYVVRRIGQ